MRAYVYINLFIGCTRMHVPGRGTEDSVAATVAPDDHPSGAPPGGYSNRPVVLPVFLNGRQRDPCLRNLTRTSGAPAGTPATDGGLKARVPSAPIL